jgi:hypothetical protein
MVREGECEGDGSVWLRMVGEGQGSKRPCRRRQRAGPQASQHQHGGGQAAQLLADAQNAQCSAVQTMCVTGGDAGVRAPRRDENCEG